MTKRGFRRPVVAALHDLFMAALSFVLSLYLRLGDAMMDQVGDFLAEGTVLFTVVCGLVFWRMRFYRALWRYASLPDLIALTKGVSLAILVFVPLLFLATRLMDYPRSAVVINWFVLLALLGGPRFLYRMIKDGGIGWALARATGESSGNRIPVLLVGAGDTAEMFIREMARAGGRDGGQAPYRVIGALDDDRHIIGGQIHGVRIIGAISDVTAVVEKLTRKGERPQRLLLSERIEGETVRELLDAADELGLTLARLPRLTDFQSGEIEDAAKLRPIAIGDLLGRAQTVLDRPAMGALIEGKRVLITGAGGTIGAELTRQVASYGPSHLVLFDNSEFNLYQIDGDIAGSHAALSRKAVLGDVRDAQRIEQVLDREKPDILFHAAAFKHVPMVESNPNEGVLTNVIGTRNLADACRAAHIETMVMISTDKAVNPSSVMGATKRIAELYCQALGAGGGGTRFVTVRFGNVLGSTGSVVPLFQRQLAAGGPLTVTHPDMTRFFMTVREAVELVLQATAIEDSGSGGGDIYVLEMGTPVLIDDLARQMIRLAGLRPDDDIAIEYSGIRDGEKMHEDLFHDDESMVPTSHAGVLLATSQAADLDELRRLLTELAAAAQARRTAETFALIHRIVPAYAALDETARMGVAQ
ncbi:MAG: nucleoside-diphosphate sugar epimerase/dehydratase [Alphaproteobacteria bacterium]